MAKTLERKLEVLLAGRAAEQVVFSRSSTGASDDLAKATGLARIQVTGESGHQRSKMQRPGGGGREARDDGGVHAGRRGAEEKMKALGPGV